MSKDNVVKFYKDILQTAGCAVDKDGNVSVINLLNTEENSPVLLDGKRLVIPTQQQLSVPDWSNRLAFHPLVENIMQDESPVLAKYRQILNQRIQGVLSLAIITLCEVASSSKDTKKLSPEQLEFLTAFKDADEKTISVLTSLLKRMPLGSVTHAFVSIYLKKGGVIQGKKFSRAAIVSFPFYTELLKDEKEVYGVSLRKKDKETFKKVMEFIFPSIAEAGSYNAGTLVKQAPFLTALLIAAGKLMDELNTVISLFSEFSGLGDYKFDLSWNQFLDEVEKYTNAIRMIPMLPGNAPEEEVVQENAVAQSSPRDSLKKLQDVPEVTAKPQPAAMTRQNEPKALDPNFGKPNPLPDFAPKQAMGGQFGLGGFGAPVNQQMGSGVVHTSNGIDPASVAGFFGQPQQLGRRGMFNQRGGFQTNNAHPFGMNSGFGRGNI